MTATTDRMRPPVTAPHVATSAAAWHVAYAARTMPRPHGVPCACSSLHDWQAVAGWKTCRRGCREGWRLP